MSLRLSKNKITYLKTEFRLCECCDGDDMELMWTSKNVVVRKVHTWEYPR